jgi:hypothetical protein
VNRSPQPDPERSPARNDEHRADLTVVEPSPVDIVRQAIADAVDRGEGSPGRPTLVKLTGLTSHAVQTALKTIRREDGGSGQQDTTADDQAPRGGRFPHLRHTWPLLVIALGAGVSVWGGWVGLGQMTGFGDIQLLPGLADDVRLNSAIVLPISVEAYGAYAVGCWLASGMYSARTTRFAGWSALISLTVGALAQVGYHVMSAAGVHTAPWGITALVACVPVAVLGLASVLARMVTNDRRAVASADGADEE